MVKAYTLIFSSYCNKTMQNRIEEHPDFESKIQDNPIELLKAIKILMHDPVRAKYPYASLVEAIIRAVTIRQQENEGLLDYVKRFKQQRDILKSQIGSEFLYKFVENTPEYRALTTDDEKTQMKEEANSKFYAYLLLKCSDQARYGSVMNGLVSQFSMGNNQYPATVTAATDILSNHRVDNRNKQKANNRPKKSSEESSDDSKPSVQETSFAQTKTVRCYCCGKDGHAVPDCSEKNTRPRDQWAIRKAEQFLQAQEAQENQQDEVEENDKASNDNAKSDTKKKSKTVGWSGMLLGLANLEPDTVRRPRPRPRRRRNRKYQ